MNLTKVYSGWIILLAGLEVYIHQANLGTYYSRLVERNVLGRVKLRRLRWLLGLVGLLVEGNLALGYGGSSLGGRRNRRRIGAYAHLDLAALLLTVASHASEVADNKLAL